MRTAFIALASRRQQPQRDTDPAMAVGPGWRVLAKSTAPRHERCVIPARDAASTLARESEFNSGTEEQIAIPHRIAPQQLAYRPPLHRKAAEGHKRAMQKTR